MNINRLGKIFLVLFLLVYSIFSTGKVRAYDPVVGEEESNVIIFIPGIMGTELYKANGQQVWFGLFNSSDLNFTNTLYQRDPLGWDDYGPSPTNFYGRVHHWFQNVTNKYKIFAFGYDWRESNTVSARNLADFIEQKKREEGVSKVNIVAHSMGGLVAKKYILDTNGESVDKFISVGTPYFGAPEAFNGLKDGFVKLGQEIITPEDGQSIPSLYQLLPSHLYFDMNDTNYIADIYRNTKGRITETYPWTYDQTATYIRKNFNTNNYDTAEYFDSAIADTIGERVKFYRIIGQS